MWNLVQLREEAVEYEDVDYQAGKTISRRHNRVAAGITECTRVKLNLCESKVWDMFSVVGSDFEIALRAKDCLYALAELSPSPEELPLSTETYACAT